MNLAKLLFAGLSEVLNPFLLSLFSETGTLGQSSAGKGKVEVQLVGVFLRGLFSLLLCQLHLQCCLTNNFYRHSKLLLRG